VARREFEEATADYIPTFGLSTNNRTASILQVIEGHKDLIIIAVPRKFVSSPCMHSKQSLS
jgi:glycerol-3-phosphate dehydrogenase